MTPFKSFIESQFPVAKVSKESYKERMSNVGQTLTGLGKWWGRKPLVLVRATILGLLMPASEDPVKDREIFLKMMAMDDEGLWQRKYKNLSLKELFKQCDEKEQLEYFTSDSSKENARWQKGLSADDKDALQKKIFGTLSYDEKLLLCQRPEHLDNLSESAWADINAHLGTDAHHFPELVEQLGQRQFGRTPRVGDAFCGGGSIPFEAARLGCEAYGSDLNPVAALLTWAALNIVGGGEEVVEQVKKAQQEVYEAVDRQITAWGIEHNEKGWRADAYLYCVEARDPQSGYMIPLAPSWVIGEKTKCIAVLKKNEREKRYDIEIRSGVSDAEMAAAKAAGTAQDNCLINPVTGDRTPIATLRGQGGLRLWDKDEIVPRPEDVFQERLYCIRYVESYYLEESGEEVALLPGLSAPEGTKLLTRKHYVAPDTADLKREAQVLKLIKERFNEWQEKGYIPSKRIEPGYNTDQPIRERGWAYWHQLFNARQLLSMGLFFDRLYFIGFSAPQTVGFLLSMGRTLNYNSKLSTWHSAYSNENVERVFTNQSLNTLYNFATRTVVTNDTCFLIEFPTIGKFKRNVVQTLNATALVFENDFWITDPPYADAVNYHELADFFLSWYEKHIPKILPEWYADSRKALAIRGAEQDFRLSMVDAYRNLANHMPDNGAQVVMFTHQSSSVWADLALILWAAGLQVSAAWTIQTETSSSLKTGNYVQGTVIMILRKQVSEDIGFLSDIQADVEHGVREQLRYMTEIEDRDDPNFEDTDYQLAAYAAALRELTRYRNIEDIDIHYELTRERRSGEQSEIEKIIDSAVRVAMDYLVPTGFDRVVWRTLTPEERFYIKALEVQSHGEHRSGVYQEMARGYGLRDYRLFLKSDKANETRLMTAIEFGNKELGREGFGQSLLRQVLFAIRQTHQEENPRPGRHWLHTETPDYWGTRQRILTLMRYLETRCEGIPHWQEDVAAARVLRGLVENDSV
jgi:putative DNA methylase